MRTARILSSLSLVLATSVFATVPKEIDLAKNGRVSFLAVGSPSALKIRGELKEVNGKPALEGKLTLDGTKLAGTAKCKLDGFDTGIGLRNEHMKNKYLETPKFPEAEVALEPVTIPEAALAGGSAQVPFSGKLTLHGTTKPFTGTLTAKGKAFSFEFPVALADHGIDIPSYLGIKVTKDVTVTVEADGDAVAVVP